MKTFIYKKDEYDYWRDNSHSDYGDWADFASMLQYTDGKPDELIDGTEVTFHAVVMGANDEDNWWWLYQINNDFFLTSGWCDYTGWDCQSGAKTNKFLTLEEALESAPEIEPYTESNTIRQWLKDQLNGNQHIGVVLKNN